MSASSAPAVPASVLAEQSRIRALIASNLCDTKIVGALEENVKFQVRPSERTRTGRANQGDDRCMQATRGRCARRRWCGVSPLLAARSHERGGPRSGALLSRPLAVEFGDRARESPVLDTDNRHHARPHSPLRTRADDWDLQRPRAHPAGGLSLSLFPRCLQVKSGSYDGESNRELLKLYAVSPDMIKLDILSRLLLKALLELPSPDFFTSMYLVSESLHTLEPLKVLLKLHGLLETCQFKRFWKEVDTFKANAANAAVLNFAEVKEFDTAIRRFVSRTVASTYSSITASQLKELWNATDKKVFEELVAAAGWTLADEGKTVVIRALPSAASKDVKPEAQRQEYPSMEQLAKLVTHVV